MITCHQLEVEGTVIAHGEKYEEKTKRRHCTCSCAQEFPMDVKGIGSVRSANHLEDREEGNNATYESKHCM